MTLVHQCSERGCSTLTMGDLCLEHERVAQQRLVSRIGTVSARLRAPAIAVGLAAVSVLLGRASGRIGA